MNVLHGRKHMFEVCNRQYHDYLLSTYTLHFLLLKKNFFVVYNFLELNLHRKIQTEAYSRGLKERFFFDPVLFQCTNHSSKKKNKDFAILYHRVLNDSWMIKHRNCLAKWLGQRGAKIKRRAFCSTETSMIKFEAAYNFIFPGVCMHASYCTTSVADGLVIIFQFSPPPILLYRRF